ncbi:hypothetical protein V8G54_010913 [Vigna mungo]|uniref:Defensin-like protein n=1 Tax=Vigna mungo TaxID=3915 RepID=A0AAQ3NZD3_VIGMU
MNNKMVFFQMFCIALLLSSGESRLRATIDETQCEFGGGFCLKVDGCDKKCESRLRATIDETQCEFGGGFCLKVGGCDKHCKLIGYKGGECNSPGNDYCCCSR